MISLKNNAQGVLSQNLPAAATALVLEPGQGQNFPDLALPGLDYFRGAISDNSGNVEYLKVTARTADVLTLLRGQEGSAAREWTAGARVQLRMTAETWREMAYERWKRLLAPDGVTLVPARLSDTSLQVNGDVTGEIQVRRSMRVVGQPTVYLITAFVFSGGKTRIEIEDGVLPAALPAVELSAEHSVSHAEIAGLADFAQSATEAEHALNADSAQTAASAGTAGSLAVPRAIRTDLASQEATNFDGSQDVNPGVSGILPVANGGTGAGAAAQALANLGVTVQNTDLTAGSSPLATGAVVLVYE